MILREARDADGPALGRLIAAVFAEYPGCLFVDAEFPELEACASHYRGKGGALFVAEDGGGLVGSLAVAATPDPGTAELFKVYVAADRRGSGLARALFEAGERFAAARGARELVLWSDTRFARSHRFYEKLGFVREPVVRYLGDASRSWEAFFRRRAGG